MSNKRVETTADYQRFNANVRVYCLTCRRTRIVDRATFNAWFMPPLRIAQAAKRLRCRRCKGLGASLTPVPR